MSDSSALIQEPQTSLATAEVDAEALGTGPQGKALRRERMQLGGKLLAQIAEVLNSAPSGSEYALVVRPILAGSTQPISAVSLPLPTGASTEATLALIKAKTDNIDVLLSTRTKPADTQKVDGSAVTQPVSAASLPLPSGASTEATLALIKAKTDNIDVALSTRTKPADTQNVSAASLPLPTNAAQETGGNLATLVAKDFATSAKQDIENAALGAPAVTPPAAATVLDRLYQLGIKIDAANKAIVAALQPRPAAKPPALTLLHR